MDREAIAVRVTRSRLRAWGACWKDDEIAALLPARGATLLRVLTSERVPIPDRIWVACHALSAREARLFAVRCARRALSRLEKPDPRSVAACDVAERFAREQANATELGDAERAAKAVPVTAEAWTAVDAAAVAASWAAAVVAAWAASHAALWAARKAAAAARAKAAAGAEEAAAEMAEWATQLEDLIGLVNRD